MTSDSDNNSRPAKARIRAATDVGGTFTDLVYYSVDPVTGEAGQVRIEKSGTTPPHFEKGVEDVLGRAGVDPISLEAFVHGSTVVINDITERKGVKVALITTAGFRDVLEIGRGNRPDLFNFNFQKPKPFVERYLRFELDERTNHKGEIQKPVHAAELEPLLAQMRADGVQAIAISFLHAYLNPENEQKAVAEIKRLWPQISVVASHELSREWGEYERTNTAVLAAYVHPKVSRYLSTLESRMRPPGGATSFYVMQSNGGVATVAAAQRNPLSIMESGPAGGIKAAAFVGRQIGVNNILALDIGGTTAKCALIHNGDVNVTTEYHIERTRKFPGYPIRTPVVDIVEIGTGGGSISWFDDGGKLHVGPQSAGAVPGPAAYGKGGGNMTTTDAHLVLGVIDPANFLGGEVVPDAAAIEAASKPLCDRLGVSKQELARGIVKIANANMTNALRQVSSNKGYDPRDFVLMAFGGGGPMHAVALAEELQISHVIVPANSSVFAAWGMLLTDLRRDYVKTDYLAFGDGAASKIAEAFAELKLLAHDDFESDRTGISLSSIQYDHRLRMRYAGQEHSVEVAAVVDANGAIAVERLVDDFHRTYEQHFSYRLPAAIEIVGFHLVATLPVEKPPLPRREGTGASAQLRKRAVDFGRGAIEDVPVFDGRALAPGQASGLAGPVVIQEPTVTLPVPAGYAVSVDDFGNYHIRAIR